MSCTTGQPKWLSMIATVLLMAATVSAAEPSREYQVKAAFIYNFTQFIEWPEGAFASADAPFVVAVLGKDPFNGALEQAMEGKRVGSRAVVVRRYEVGSVIGPCQILFVPLTEESAVINKLPRLVGDRPILTVGESDAFLPLGGIFRFYTEDKKVRFEVSTQPAEQRRLKISSKLLKLARIYKK
ncbi:MAG: YfiR family protein [Burkholderiales bacterium]|nr:YfiR family protein [Phycisphaerae bacterium]